MRIILFILVGILTFGCAMDGNTLKFKFHKDAEDAKKAAEKREKELEKERFENAKRTEEERRIKEFTIRKCKNDLESTIDFEHKSYNDIPEQKCFSYHEFQSEYEYKCSLTSTNRTKFIEDTTKELENKKEAQEKYEQSLQEYKNQLEEYGKRRREAHDFLDTKCKEIIQKDCQTYISRITGLRWQECEDVLIGYKCSEDPPSGLKLPEGTFNEEPPRYPERPYGSLVWGEDKQNQKKLERAKIVSHFCKDKINTTPAEIDLPESI